MATKLLRPITREMISRPQMGKHRGRPMRVTLEPGDYLRFTPKGTRQNYEVSLASAYSLAMLIYVNDEYKKKLDNYNLKKNSGQRTKRPKKPFVPVPKILFKMI